MIRTEFLCKSFGKLDVLKDISTNIDKGEVVAIIGPSGSGKSTFLRCLNLLEFPTRGRVYIDEIDITLPKTDIKKVRQNMGMVFQHFNLFPHKTVMQNVTYGPCKVKKMPEAEAKQLGLDLLTKVGLAEKADIYPSRLSGGQKQRVAIARALAMEPAVLLCDEITSALDPELVGEVLRVVESLATEGMTLLMVTHEMSFARKVSDRVIFMHQGRVHEMGPPAEVFGNPQTPELKQFLSSLHD